MKKIVIMPGGFHPFHAGHYALYKSAIDAFPDADVFVAATNDQKERPFPFEIKEKLAKVAGVAPGKFIQVKSPFKPREITDFYDPNQDVLIFVRSEKDKNESPKPGGIKKDGSPSYLQPYDSKEQLQPFSRHAYMAYLPTVEFGPGIKSATEIRNAWPNLNDRQKTAMVMSLYPAAQKNKKLAQNIVQMMDIGMGNHQITEDSSEESMFPNDVETQKLLAYAQQHYPGAHTKQQAFIKYVLRSLEHSKEEDNIHDNELHRLSNTIEKLTTKINSVNESIDYLDEK